MKISTHAPIRVATRWCLSAVGHFYFNSHTCMECDLPSGSPRTLHCYFNSRTHTGCAKCTDEFLRYLMNFNSHALTGYDIILSGFNQLKDISTHAPSRTATIFMQRKYYGHDCNSRALTDCDVGRRQTMSTKDEFQLTRSHGVRLRSKIPIHKFCNFNSRALTGCDTKLLKTAVKFRFQLTRPHGVRQWQACFGRDCSYFNSRALTGCDIKQ